MLLKKKLIRAIWFAEHLRQQADRTHPSTASPHGPKNDSKITFCSVARIHKKKKRFCTQIQASGALVVCAAVFNKQTNKHI